MISILVLSLVASLSGQCTVVDTTIKGNSMQGLLFDKQKISVRSMECEGLERFDHLLFTHDETESAVVKQLWGFPGDTLKVEDNGTFYVNGVKAITPFKRPYVLLGSAKTRLKKLEGTIDGYLLLGQPGSLDSARAGLFHEKDLLGWVDKEETFIEEQRR